MGALFLCAGIYGCTPAATKPPVQTEFDLSALASKNIDASELERIVESHEGRPLDLLVWNSKSQSVRGKLVDLQALLTALTPTSVVPIVPSRQWSMPYAVHDPKEPETERKPSLLGLSMRMCEPEFAMENVWHVLDVLEGSPAESAGLVPYGDWIIGWSGGVLSTEGDFYEVVEAVCPFCTAWSLRLKHTVMQHVEKPLRVFVYSYDFEYVHALLVRGW